MYPYRELTPVVTLLRADFASAFDAATAVVAEAPVVAPGTLHAVVVWVDYLLDPAGASVLSTGVGGCVLCA